MNNLNIKGIGQLVFGLSLVLFLTNCTNIDQTIVTEVDENGQVVEAADAWICEMKSFSEDRWRYELYMQDNGDYVAVSDARILRVSKDGLLNSNREIGLDDDDREVYKIYNEKIYRFYYDNDFQDFDPEKKIKLQIYDLAFNLLSDVVLDSNGLIYDVEIENENQFGFLIYNPNQSQMKLKKIHLDNGLVAEVVLSTSGTKPRDLHISESGEYYCTDSSNQTNLYYFDDDLNLRWEQRFGDYVISDAKLIEGRGFYITGSIAEFGSEEFFVALVDFNGDLTNSVIFDGGDRWSPKMQINDEKICLMQSEPESSKNLLLTILDLDFNIESKIDIPGNIVQSKMIINDNNSFSFVYGIAFDDLIPDFFPEEYFTRIFKFDRTYTLPTHIIEQ